MSTLEINSESFFHREDELSSDGRVTVINGNNIDQIRQKLDYSEHSKVTQRLKRYKPRSLDRLSFIFFPLLFILYNILYWNLQCI